MQSIPYEGPQKSENFEMSEYGQPFTQVGDVAAYVEKGVVRVEKSLLAPVEKFLNWKPWELFVRLAMVVLLLYTLHRMSQDKQSQSVTNYLLLLIAVSIFVQIHQNVNVQAQLAM